MLTFIYTHWLYKNYKIYLHTKKVYCNEAKQAIKPNNSYDVYN